MPVNAFSDEQIQATVIRVIAETQRKDPAAISPDATFEQLGIDSMDGVNIVFAVENEFDINVPDDKVRDLRSVQDVVEGVKKLLLAKAPAGPTAA